MNDTAAEAGTMDLREFLSVLGIHERVYYRRRDEGLVLPPLPYSGGRPRWSRDEVRRWIAAGAPPVARWRQKTQA